MQPVYTFGSGAVVSFRVLLLLCCVVSRVNGACVILLAFDCADTFSSGNALLKVALTTRFSKKQTQLIP